MCSGGISRQHGLLFYALNNLSSPLLMRSNPEIADNMVKILLFIFGCFV
jgi:hypothetical protein